MEEAVKNKIIDFFKSNTPDLSLLYLFGSCASMEDNKYSDIDIAYLTKQKNTNLERFELQEHIARKLNRDVDLVDLESANDVIRMQIIGKGNLLFFSDFQEKERFENRVFQDYIYLKENIKEILIDIKLNKKVYG